MSFWQVGISSHTLFAYIVPSLFKTFQDISILYFGRCGIVECSKLYGENILPMRENQLSGIIQSLFQYGTSSRHHVYIRHQQLGENHWRHIITLPDGIGIEIENTCTCPEKYITGSSIFRSRFTETYPEKYLLIGIILKFLLGRNKLTDTVFRTEP